MTDLLPPSPQDSPVRRRLAVPKWVKLLVVVDAVVLVVAIGIFTAMRRTDDRENVVNPGLRGSKPPAGQRMPDLSRVAGIAPVMPSPKTLRGGVTYLVGTCMACPSGDVIGGALRRLGVRDLPKGTRVEVVAWQGDAKQWRAAWQIPERVPLHVVTGAADIAQVKATLGIGSDGFGYLYDRDGIWRASYAVQLMQPDDVVHDMRVLAG